MSQKVPTNFTTGQRQSFGGEYLELVAYDRIRYTDKFDDPNLPGEMQTIVIHTLLTNRLTQAPSPDSRPVIMARNWVHRSKRRNA
jgi:uncharacterized protein YndB with AHSA1/START domain